MTESSPPPVTPALRYEEHTVDGITVGILADPEFQHAWIQSDRTVDLSDWN